MLSRLVAKRSVALWGAGAEEFWPGRSAGEEDAAAAVGSNYGFLIFLEEPRECIGDALAKVNLQCLLTATISRFEFEQGGKREGLLRRGSPKIPRGYSYTVKGVV
ncbi:hypothetical protein B9Z19DRAFT_1118274 [Tuber borchii]|uniref:Uncharacterized protein n=1 Tax=Tuber borchii TaxID=42251 RepID=A0A2T7A8V6_TUBBO|nr:hypothetical protein B9Z19DRAFT_1118274 [Tuber borchii]